MSSGNEKMHGARDVVAQLEQRERTLVRENGLVSANGHPLLAHLVVLGAGKSAEPIQTAPNGLVATSAHMMIEQLAAHAVLTRLSDGEVTALRVRLGL